METMIALGTFRFALSSAAYQRLRRTHAYRWPAQQRLIDRPARQFIGLGDELIQFKGIVYPAFRGGLQQIQQLRTLAGQGKALLLTDGLGIVWGRYAVLRVEEEHTIFLSNGVPLKQEFTLQLAHAGEN